MDDIDRAQAREEWARDDAERAQRVRAQREALPYTGQCHHCGALTGGGRRFCDTDCRDDYEHARRMRHINGGG